MDRIFYKNAFELKSIPNLIKISILVLCMLINGLTAKANANYVQEQLAQGITSVSGKVIDESGATLPGVTVIEKGTTNGAVTDFEGNYTLGNLKAGTTLVFSFIGMKTQEIVVTTAKLNVTLKSDAIGLEEVVAVGYGTVKKRDITGSVASVGGETLASIPVASAAEAMSGRLAGVQITSTEGSPDAELTIRVRGGGSITQDNSPLIIVDGFPVSSMSDISPSDIESIDVLKDASSTAIYGSRGANGVIIITTKGGDEGKVQVSYNAFTGVKKIAKTMDVMNPYEYVNWQYEYNKIRYKDRAEDLNKFTDYYGNYQDIDLYKGLEGNNWQDQVYGRTGTVFSQDLSVRGGTKKVKYALSYAGYDEKAIMIGSSFNRDNLSLKLNANPNDKIDLSFSARYSTTNISGGGANENSESSNSADSRLKHAITYSPIPLSGLTSDATDEEIQNYVINPITSVNDSDRLRNRRNLNLNGNFGWEIFENFKLNISAGLDTYDNEDKRFFGKTTYYVDNTPTADLQGMPAVRLSDKTEKRFRNANTVNYDFKKLLNNKDHSINVLAGMEIVSTKEVELTTEVHGLPTDFTFENAYKLTTQGTPFTTNNEISPDDKLLSFFGRANYDYQGKYLASATFRADGSSRFAEGNRWGYFPSVALAWRLSQENFMENTNSWLDDLKLRLSYGTAGNNNIPAGQMDRYYSSNNSAWMNGSNSYWSASKTMYNPDLLWETTQTRNIGLDFTLLGTKLNGTIDGYWNTTSDLLIEFPVAGTGYDYQYRNMGETQNTGVEFTLNWNAIAKKDYGLSFNFNIGFNKNKINSLGEMDYFRQNSNWASTEIGDDFEVRKGGSVGAMYGYVNDGMYRESDFSGYDQSKKQWILATNDDGKTLAPDASGIIGNPRPGMMKVKDLNNDGQITIDDQKIIGDANPKASGGFSINAYAKGFDFAAVFNYRIGGDVYNANKIEYTSATQRYPYRNMLSDVESGKRYTYIDEVGNYVTDLDKLASMNSGASTWSPYMDRFVFSDWAVEDGSFLRLSTLTLGYTLSKDILSKLKVSNLRVYTTAYNLFCLTNYSGFDPEVSTMRRTALTPNVDYSAYPRSRSIVFGVNLNF